jgi:nicotinate-nucleotide adenylyltransferase
MSSLTLIFGGSFDPIHTGHVAMFDAAFQALNPTKALVIPVGNAWQKARMPYANSTHRTAMLKLAFAPYANTHVDTRELQRGGPTYSVDTMRELRRDFPNEQFVWLLGGDAFSKLDSWEEPHVLARLTRFAVVRRAGDVITPPKTALTHEVIACEPPAISSTQIRERIARGESIADLVPASVADYISQHQLYQPK